MHTAFRLVVAVLLGASLLPLPRESARAFSTTGDSLDLGQRDLRVFDNFTQAGLHENQTEHPNLPGADQVSLAAWKSAAEWGSRPFGLGSGDPSQPALGSGGADFDFVWNGAASGIGSTNDNVISMIAGSGGGVVAVLEFPTTDGWRLRYYEDADLDDGPGDPAAGRIDFQGLNTHMLGHGLGLGHSSVNGSTMWPSFGAGSISARSIAADDRAGVQAVYGALDPAKPRIDAVVGSRVPGGTAAVLGSGFAAAGNELWFANSLLDGGPAGGEPFVLAGLASQAGGTRIDFVVPAAGAEAGGLHVRVPGTGGRHLSEGHPFRLGSAVDALILEGPAELAVGDLGEFAILDLASGDRWAILLGADLNGSTLFGQVFDLGPPLRLVAQGVAGASGLVAWTSPPVPAQASGRTLLLEAGAANPLGVVDSNPLAVPVR